MWENLEINDEFLEKQYLPRLNQDNLNNIKLIL